jgi:hypothetical protein
MGTPAYSFIIAIMTIEILCVVIPDWIFVLVVLSVAHACWLVFLSTLWCEPRIFKLRVLFCLYGIKYRDASSDEEENTIKRVSVSTNLVK